MQPVKLVLAGGTPDRLNRNTVLRSHVAEGFEEVLGPGSVANVPLEFAEERIREARPQMVLVFGSCQSDQCDYFRLRDACDAVGCPLAFWLHDDPYEFDASAKVLRLADYIFSNDRWAAEHYHRNNVRHLPLAASPTAHRSSQSHLTNDKVRDVFFCGVAYSSRQRIVADLADILKAVHTEIFGEDWKASLSFCKNDRIDNARLCDYYASSRVVLNLGRDFHYSNKRYQLDPSTPGPRTFEAAMAGACQMMFADSLEILDYFKLGEEIVLFDDPAGFRKSLFDLLENPDRCAKIGAAARSRCLTEHTYACRAKSILHCLGIESRKPAVFARAVA